jgi:hypothetical protein
MTIVQMISTCLRDPKRKMRAEGGWSAPCAQDTQPLIKPYALVGVYRETSWEGMELIYLVTYIG